MFIYLIAPCALLIIVVACGTPLCARPLSLSISLSTVVRLSAVWVCTGTRFDCVQNWNSSIQPFVAGKRICHDCELFIVHHIFNEWIIIMIFQVAIETWLRFYYMRMFAFTNSNVYHSFAGCASSMWLFIGDRTRFHSLTFSTQHCVLSVCPNALDSCMNRQYDIQIEQLSSKKT